MIENVGYSRMLWLLTLISILKKKDELITFPQGTSTIFPGMCYL